MTRFQGPGCRILENVYQQYKATISQDFLVLTLLQLSQIRGLGEVPSRPPWLTETRERESNHEPVKQLHNGVPEFPRVDQGPPDMHVHLSLMSPTLL